jgi:hypothetical protein
LGIEVTRAAGKSQWHWRMRGDDGNNKALPQTSNVGSDKRRSREGRDSRVVMLGATADNGSSGQRQQLQMMMVADNNGT